jgi:hypothetical protein
MPPTTTALGRGFACVTAEFVIESTDVDRLQNFQQQLDLQLARDQKLLHCINHPIKRTCAACHWVRGKMQASHRSSMLSTNRSPSLQPRNVWNAGMTSLLVKTCRKRSFTCEWATSWLGLLTALLSCHLVRVVSSATAAAQALAGQLGRQER